MPELIRQPLYQQIVTLLRQELAEGKYPVNSRFPSERELAARFEISRTTANKVLSVMAADGLLQHRNGIGAYVSGKPLQHDMSALISFTEKAKRSGLVPKTQVLVFEHVNHGELGEAIYIERLRTVDDVPVILEKRWLDGGICAGLTQELVTGSLYDALSNKLGVAIAYAEQRARAVSPDAHERALLHIKQGQACLRVEGKGYLADGRVIWQENTLFRGDRYEIHGLLSPAGHSFGRLI